MWGINQEDTEATNKRFIGGLRSGNSETQIQVKPKECSGGRESGAYKDNTTKLSCLERIMINHDTEKEILVFKGWALMSCMEQ